jgi:hypothetical protein
MSGEREALAEIVYRELGDLVNRNYLIDPLERLLAQVKAEARVSALAEAALAVERQTNLPDLVHFDKPSDFRKGVLTALMAVRALVDGGTP